MSALTQDRKTDKAGPDDVVYPGLLKYPVDASTTIYGGAIVCIDAAGYATSTATPVNTMKIVGRCERQVANQTTGGSITPDGIASGVAGSVLVQVRQGFYYYNVNADTTPAVTTFGANLYASDDNTLSTSDAGGTRPYAGWCFDPGGTYSMDQIVTTNIGVALGFPNPYSALSTPSLNSVGKFRAVVTTLQAYGGSGTNVLTQTTAAAGLSAADGVTLAVGDVCFIQGGTTNLTAAKDSGPWSVTALGSASVKWVLTRPDWFTTGAVIPLGQVLEGGGEGTSYGGSSWKSFAAKGSAVVGTNDPTFYIGRYTAAVTLASGFIKLGAGQTFPGLYSTTTSGIEFQATNITTTTTTIRYVLGAIGSGGSATAAGYMGTSTVSVTGITAAGAVVANDASSGLLTITNW
jgi:hypothetical protein